MCISCLHDGLSRRAKVKYRDKKYNIYRSYERNDEKIELYCEVKVGG